MTVHCTAGSGLGPRQQACNKASQVRENLQEPFNPKHQVDSEENRLLFCLLQFIGKASKDVALFTLLLHQPPVKGREREGGRALS